MASTPFKKRIVLVIEPEAVSRSTLQRYIQLSGYQVLEAKSGKEGLEILQDHTPDLVLLDLSLPDMEGLAMLRMLRETYAQLRIITLASQPDMPKAHQALEYGAGDYIAKPVDLPSLKRTLVIHLGPSH